MYDVPSETDEPRLAGSHGAGEPATPAHAKADRILEAARRLFADQGHAALTVAEISREAGVSRGLLHYYFESKEQILTEVVRRNVEESIEQTERLLAAATTVDELLEQFLAAYGRLLDRSAQGYALYYEAFVQARVHPAVGRELEQLHQARRDALARALVAARERGAVVFGHDAAALASLLLAIGDGVALQYLSDPRMPLAAVARILEPTLAQLLGGDRG